MISSKAPQPSLKGWEVPRKRKAETSITGLDKNEKAQKRSCSVIDLDDDEEESESVSEADTNFLLNYSDFKIGTKPLPKNISAAVALEIDDTHLPAISPPRPLRKEADAMIKAKLHRVIECKDAQIYELEQSFVTKLDAEIEKYKTAASESLAAIEEKLRISL